MLLEDSVNVGLDERQGRRQEVQVMKPFLDLEDIP